MWDVVFRIFEDDTVDHWKGYDRDGAHKLVLSVLRMWHDESLPILVDVERGTWTSPFGSMEIVRVA